MPSTSIIVPTILTSGALHFASVGPEDTAQDVIDALVKVDEVRSEVLGDLEDRGWALQKIRVEQSGRQWEEDELEGLGDGELCDMTIQWPFFDVSLVL